MRISDWSSDVCSSDLAIGIQWFWSYEYPDNGDLQITANMLKEKDQVPAGDRYRTDADGPRLLAADNRVVLPVGVPIRDRKSVGEGQSVAVRVSLGGRRIHKKKKNNKPKNANTT